MRHPASRLLLLLALGLVVSCGEGDDPELSADSDDASDDGDRSSESHTIRDFIRPRDRDASLGPSHDHPRDTEDPKEPRGLMWTWKTGQELVIGPTGFGYYIPTFKYEFIHFGADGYAWVGTPRPELSEMECKGPRKNDYGACVPFEVGDGTIVLNGDSSRLERVSSRIWKIGQQDYLPVDPQPTGATLDGSFQSIECILSTCTTTYFSFSRDGTFRYTGVSNVFFTSALGTTSGGGSSQDTGTYRIGPYSITLTPPGGSPSTLFFFRKGEGSNEVIQVDTTHFNRS